jgi:uncharacterized membrane protein YphA (DoxX/SURF4 family)
MEFLEDFFAFLGRLLIGGVFLWGAIDKIRHWNRTVTHMRTKHIPQLKIVLPISMALRVLGSVSLILGWYVHLGAFLLLLAAIPSAMLNHPFWKVGHEMDKALFMKEVAIIGGLFMILALGGGHFGFVS